MKNLVTVLSIFTLVLGIFLCVPKRQVYSKPIGAIYEGPASNVSYFKIVQMADEDMYKRSEFAPADSSTLHLKVEQVVYE